MQKKILRERKSSTKQKIITLLENRKEALTHKDIQLYFNETLDRVTIYRALERLITEGKIHKTLSFEGVVQYALCSKCNHTNDIHNHNHIHFTCEKCKKTTCLNDNTPKIVLPSGFINNEIQIIISGICSNCNNEDTKNQKTPSSTKLK